MTITYITESNKKQHLIEQKDFNKLVDMLDKKRHKETLKEFDKYLNKPKVSINEKEKVQVPVDTKDPARPMTDTEKKAIKAAKERARRLAKKAEAQSKKGKK